MKKLGALLLTLALLVGLLPQTAMAAQSATFEQDLIQYLNEVSTERGLEVTKGVLDLSLGLYEVNLTDFTTIEELKLLLGDVIKADLSNLSGIYKEFSLNQDTLTTLLSEYGEELNDYIFVNELSSSLILYTGGVATDRDPEFDQDLQDYLNKVSTERGFAVTQESIEAYLDGYFVKLDYFSTVNELSEFLGDVIKADLSNLYYFIDAYGLDQEALLQLLEENGKNINDYIFISSLEEVVWSNSEGTLPGFDLDTLKDLFAQIGLTEGELAKLEAHLASLEEYLSSEEVVAQLEDLGTRMMTFAEALISAATENPDYMPTEQEIAELVSLYNEALSMLKLDIKISMVRDGVETPVSIDDYITLKPEDFLDADIKIAIYSTETGLLADVVVTSDMINEQLGGLIEVVEDTVNSNPEKETLQTVKGGKLPKTASNYIPNALFGLAAVVAGILLYRKVRNEKGEILK